MTGTDRTLPGVVVAVDGPSGSGKSSTARGVARRLGLRYLDTGSMYRAVTWWAVGQRLVPPDATARDLAARVTEPHLEVTTDPDDARVLVDGRDVSEAIRSPEVTAAVSWVSAVPEVRGRLVEVQRAVIEAGGVVVEGRDIGTVVAPHADVKVFLVADPAARARRRAADWSAHDVSVDDTQAALERRDEMDSTRELSPLTQADDAVLVDSTTLSLDEVIELVVGLVDQARGGGSHV